MTLQFYCVNHGINKIINPKTCFIYVKSMGCEHHIICLIGNSTKYSLTYTACSTSVDPPLISRPVSKPESVQLGLPVCHLSNQFSLL